MPSKEPVVFNSGFETYTVVRPIGSGGQGTVFEVTDTQNQRFALKVVDSSRVGKDRLKRFRNEIQFCLQERSAHIIQVLDHGRGDGSTVFYVMPHYPSTLRKLMSEGIQSADVLPLYCQVLDAVDAAHLLGTIHRDIKPENILWDPAKNLLVLADFGIARFKEADLATDIHTGSHERLANFAYAAPEQRLPGGTVGCAADIYALGLLLNEMYTRKIPHGVGFTKIKDVAPGQGYLDELVDLMIQQEPGKRPQSVRQIKEELIGRGNAFAQLQQLNQLKRTVIPDSEVSDHILEDPIRVVALGAYDVDRGTLSLKLNQGVNQIWEECFRYRATAVTANYSAANIRFSNGEAHVTVSSHFLQAAIDFLKASLVAANEQYASEVRRRHQAEIESRRAVLRSQIAKQETMREFLSKLRI